ncbi:hypothetical protein ONE63_004317 [Megalurothrips usitatus]|uniref:Uncharacterized protein n=1 Tax=Megalurothrips usitatus TaxID=439358 RepID=A0AAV7X9B9_9NEOP|nr:hypothetical protein ONE63_004317 [Megalurothrips usitatus]
MDSCLSAWNSSSSSLSKDFGAEKSLSACVHHRMDSSWKSWSACYSKDFESTTGPYHQKPSTCQCGLAESRVKRSGDRQPCSV